MTVGMFGGTFDPVHNAHVSVVREALSQARLASLLVVPNGCPPHRGAPRAPIGDRLEMLRVAMRGEPRAEVWDAERDEGEAHYTIDTVRRLRARFPGESLVLVVGSDSAAALDEWREWRELAGMCGWLVVPRAGRDFPGEAHPVVLDELGGGLVPPGEVGGLPGRAAVLEGPVETGSASEVRARLRDGRDAGGLLPPGVLRHIRERGLYGCHA